MEPSNSIKHVTCIAPANIAVIKYWGKRNDALILPLNSSISVTLHTNQMRTKTTVAVSAEFAEDRMWLNDKEVTLDQRVQTVLMEVRRRCGLTSEGSSVPSQFNESHHVHICSENNFPTAAGLASSAAGYACLVFALTKLFNIQGEISDIARIGSGSASRSVYGGFVEWNMGTSPDGGDSIATQIRRESDWPDLRALILVVKKDKKCISSTDGMRRSTLTSSLLNHRIHTVVPDRITQMRQAIRTQDFQLFAELTMKDSNQLHSICQDSYPPICYLNEVSHRIIALVHAYNDIHQCNMVAYTFDAGPNACLFLLESSVAPLLSILDYMFKEENCTDFVHGGNEKYCIESSKDICDFLPSTIQPIRGGVQYVICTRPGPGPQILEDPNECLLDRTGLPK